MNAMPYRHSGEIEMPSTITKYNYRGVPAQSKADVQAGPVKLRKRKIDEKTAMDCYNGCNKFATKQHAHHVNHVQPMQEQSALDQFNNFWSNPRHARDTAGIPHLANKLLEPFVDDSQYLDQATNAAEEKLMT